MKHKTVLWAVYKTAVTSIISDTQCTQHTQCRTSKTYHIRTIIIFVVFIVIVIIMNAFIDFSCLLLSLYNNCRATEESEKSRPFVNTSFCGS